MYFQSHKTALQTSLDNSKKEFLENYDTTKLLSNPNDAMFEGAPLVKCFPNSKAVNDLLKTGTFTRYDELTLTDNTTCKETELLLNSLTSTIVNIDNAGNYSQCIQKIHLLQTKLKTMLYGVILINGKTLLNPLHPITAMLMADTEKYKELHNLNYRIAIYAYDSIEVYETIHQKYYSSTADPVHIQNTLNNLVKVSAHQVQTKIKLEKIDESTNSNDVLLKYRLSKYQNENPDFEFYLSAHQMLTKGIVLPYYGASFIKLNGSTVGAHITPQHSCNISGDCLPPTLTASTKWRSVCTGSLPNSTLTGLRTLNHANLLSPYNKVILTPGALVYAQMAVIQSLKIYRSANIIQGDIDETNYITEDRPSKPDDTEIIQNPESNNE